MPAVATRQEQVLALGQEGWNEARPAVDADTFNSGLGAARSIDSLHWAEELWLWAHEQSFLVAPVPYMTLALVLEEHGLHERVEDLLVDLKMRHGVPFVVMLGALVNAAAERCDWRRAELLWEKLTGRFGVQTNEIAVATRQKLI